jgi:hypothetical protein
MNGLVVYMERLLLYKYSDVNFRLAHRVHEIDIGLEAVGDSVEEVDIIVEVVEIGSDVVSVSLSVVVVRNM